MARAGAAGAGAVRRRARRLDRQRRAAVDRPRPAVLPGRPVVGRQHLHALLRRLPAARRPPGRPARSAAPVRRRPRPVRARVAGRWSRHLARHADRGSRGPGPRRGAALPGGALARHRDLRRGRRAQQGARRLGRGRRLRRRGRRAARRRADRVRGLGVGAVRQRADRPARRGRRARACCPRAATPGARNFDVAGAVLVTAGLSLLVYTLVDANDAGWTSGADARPGRGLARAARPRSWRSSCAPRRRSCRSRSSASARSAARTWSRCSSRWRCSRCSSSSRSTCSRCSATTRSRPGSPTCRWRSGSSSRPASRPRW